MVFLDLPGANEFTVGVMALVAQHEARMISSGPRPPWQRISDVAGFWEAHGPNAGTLRKRAASVEPGPLALPSRGWPPKPTSISCRL